ncbi:uncharacterized protein LOC131221019 [Magnolia sinica]|uniref:uncharacterized protein LOC131221019 n=1 Tax=Magnolia sinica TaxID=86752 RepID=UPI00265A78A4|nr:uncharacterized protein LOC131221019 [Magnolia sinica]XP_058072075.1 uncharacterized protein LOC131221019 [Magnolia sinica]XP_058072076.1 uncharacterized protein LOC131221019 [Magnolia sinica]
MELHKDKNVASSNSMIEGAIFMSNRATKKECLKRKLFGLPPSQAPFVKQVKTGTILFLFEYEERKLYGVFEAASDGALNIEPRAFNSLGKPFTAQIRFQRIWSCHPLSEPEFCDAIKDNYYTTKKFHMYLSQEQVLKLLLLFSSKKIKIQGSPSIETGNKSLKQSRKHGRSSIRVTVTADSVGNELAMDNDTEIVNMGRYPDFSSADLNHHSYYNKPVPKKEDSIDGQALSLPISRSSEHLELDFMPPTPRGDGSAMGNFHNSPLHSHCHYTMDPRFHYSQSSFSPHLAHDPFSRSSIESLLSSSKSHLHQSHMDSDALDPSSTRHGSLGISTKNGGYKVPSVPDCYGPSGVSIPSSGTGYLETRRIDSKSAEDCRDLSFTNRHEASSASIPFLGARHFENMNIDSRDDDGCRGLSFNDSHEPSMPAIPLLQAANFGKKSIDSSFIRSPSKNLSSVCESNVHGYAAFQQHEEGHVGPPDVCFEPSTATMHLSGDGNFIVRAVEPSNFLGPDKDPTGVNEYDCPLESWFAAGYGRMGHHNSTHHEEYYPDSSLNSKCYDRRPSVFSRLSAATDASFEDGESHESDADVSMSELVKILHRRRKDWRKLMKKYKQLNAQNHDDRTDMDLMRADVQINEEDLWVGYGTAEVSCKSPFLNFKRRSEVRKVGNETEMGGHVVVETSKGSSGKQKRRKLIRPPLMAKEPFDKGSNECLNMDGSSQGVATGLASVQTSEGEKINGRIIRAPVKNDERDECNERGLPRKVDLSGDDDSGRLEGSSNHITNDRNAEGQPQELSNCQKSDVDVERNAGGPSLESQSDQPSVGNVTSEGNTGGSPDGDENAIVTADDASVRNVIGERNTEEASDSNEISKMAVDDEAALVGNFKGKGNAEGLLNGGVGNFKGKGNAEGLLNGGVSNENGEGKGEAFEELGEKSTLLSVGQGQSVNNNQVLVRNVEGEDENGSSEVGNASAKLLLHNILGKDNEDFGRENEVMQVDEAVDQGGSEDYIPL